ncbi:hypothetical protein [Streptomyces sp. NPDC055060]
MSQAPAAGAPALAAELHHGHARALSRHLGRKLARTDLRARRLAHTLALQRAGTASSDVDLAFELADAVTGLHLRARRLPSMIGAPPSPGAEARTDHLAQGLEVAVESAYELVRQLEREHPRGSAQAKRIGYACAQASGLLSEFTTALHGPATAPAALSRQRRVSLTARWLICSAAHVLPASEQARYAEEWRGELWDLAAEPRRRHLAHAVRVTLRAWTTRRAVLRSRRDDDGGAW